MFIPFRNRTTPANQMADRIRGACEWMTEGESESGKKTRTGSRNRENYTRNISWYTYILCLWISRVRFSPFRPMVPYAIFRASGVSVCMRCVCGIRVSYLWFSLISRMNFPKNSISNSSMAHFLLLSYSLCLPICFLFHMNTFVLIWFLFLLVCQRTMHSSFVLCVLNGGRGGGFECEFTKHDGKKCHAIMKTQTHHFRLPTTTKLHQTIWIDCWCLYRLFPWIVTACSSFVHLLDGGTQFPSKLVALCNEWLLFKFVWAHRFIRKLESPNSPENWRFFFRWMWNAFCLSWTGFHSFLIIRNCRIESGGDLFYRFIDSSSPYNFPILKICLTKCREKNEIRHCAIWLFSFHSYSVCLIHIRGIVIPN